jgi:hypothetical protein
LNISDVKNKQNFGRKQKRNENTVQRKRILFAANYKTNRRARFVIDSGASHRMI